MSSQYFLNQRRQGKVAQEIVALKLRDKGFNVSIVPEGQFVYWDMIVWNDKTKFAIEVKYDRMATQSGNIYVDIQSLKKSKATILAYVIDEPSPKVFIMPTHQALAYAEKYPSKKRGGEFREESAL